jgi:hypothetical protein
VGAGDFCPSLIVFSLLKFRMWRMWRIRRANIVAKSLLTDLDALRARGIAYPATLDGWRWAYRRRRERGLDGVFSKVGRRIFVDTEKYLAIAGYTQGSVHEGATGRSVTLSLTIEIILNDRVPLVDHIIDLACRNGSFGSHLFGRAIAKKLATDEGTVLAGSVVPQRLVDK